MQALQMSGQAAEYRDPLPVKGPASGDVDNSEHPFMKLLARLRNAMKQGDESGKELPDGVSRPTTDSPSREKSRKASAGSSGTASESSDPALGDDTGIQGIAAAVSKSGVPKSLADPGLKSGTELPESALAVSKEKTRSLDQKGILAAKAGQADAQARTVAAGTASGALAEGTTRHGIVQLDPNKQSGFDDRTTQAKSMRNSESTAEAFARRRNFNSPGKLDGAVLAASGGLNGSMNAAGLNRNQNAGAFRDREGQTNPVEDAKASSRRPSRYSVVDMRLKASAGKASQEAAEGRQEGKPGALAAQDLNRSGMSGTDAAGRQTGSDPAAGDLHGSAKGSGSEASERSPAGFADNLAARLRDGGSMDIVRSAQVVLKDGDAGLIRLRLEPESLGGVKIELKMADKQISARIIVESDLAGEAFRSSLDSLRDAFASSGFETTSIEVEVRDGRAGAGDAGKGNSGNDEEANELYMARKAGELGDAVPAADAAYGRSGVIDLVV
jgi:flagellar hook-length control protein FliK